MSQPEGASRGRALAAAAPLSGWRAVFNRWLILPAAAIGALVIGAVIIAAMGASPLTGYHALISGAFGGSYQLASTAVKAVPLLLVGVGICISFRANVLNIGGEGQIVMGGLASAGDRARAAEPAGLRAHPAGAAGRGRRRGDLGCHPRRVQGLPGRQRGPVHDHAQPGCGPADELPAGRPNDRQDGVVRGRRPDPADPAAVAELVAADHRSRHPAASGRGHRGAGRGGGMGTAPADRIRVPHPRRRAVHRRGQLRGDGRQADYDAGPDPVRGDVRAGRRDARIRQHQPPDGDRRLAHRVHRQRRLLRDRRRAVRRPQPTVDDPVRVPVRRPAGRRRLDGHRTERALLLRPGHHDRRPDRLLCRGARRRPAAVRPAGRGRRSRQRARAADQRLAAARSCPRADRGPGGARPGRR